MIYLTFDSNIWIYLLDNASKKYNPLDYIEHWIEEGHVQILLPEIIHAEWGKHRESQKSVYEENLQNFFAVAKDVFDDDMIRAYYNPEQISKIIEIQFNRIDEIIRRSLIIKSNNELKAKLVDWGIQKKAPLHKKSSVADAMIILSLFEYAEENPNHAYFFVTENKTDFYLKGKIHPHLEPECTRLRIEPLNNLKSLIGKLRSRLNVTVDIEAKRRSRFHETSKDKIYNQEAIEGFAEFEDSYLEDIKDIDEILNKTQPTKNQLLALFGSLENPKLEEYFFQKVSSPIWFPILKKRGYFAPEKNPDPIQLEKGSSIPFWQSLFYLERLTLNREVINDHSLVNEILEVIKDITRHPKDNYRTWHIFIRILKNIPNELIRVEIINLIPEWFNTSFGTSLQTSEIIQTLLPKFINDNSSQNDIEKGSIIFEFLISLNKRELSGSDFWFNEEPRYTSNIDIYYLGHSLASNETGILSLLAEYCSNKIILLAQNIRRLLYDFPRGLNVSFGEDGNKVSVKLSINERELIVQLVLNNSLETLQTRIIRDFDKYEVDQIKETIISFLSEFGFEYEVTEENEMYFNHILYFTKTDLSYGHHKIDELDEENDSSLLAAMILLLRNLLTEKSKSKPREGQKLLSALVTDKLFSSPIFSQIVFFVIRSQWGTQKKVFFDLIKNNDPKGYFSDETFYSDLFNLIEQNQDFLTKKEIELLDSIIEKGPNEDESTEYWKFRWYSALSKVDFFRVKYNLLKNKIETSIDEFRDEGKMKVSINAASVSPFTPEELIKMTNEEIYNFIYTFKSDDWRGPNIEGLADSLSKAVAMKPGKFVDGLDFFVDTLYIYENKIIHGFLDAWKDRLDFNLDKVLDFCSQCITSDKFLRGELNNPKDGWRADKGWVKNAVSELISEGFRKDDYAFDKKHLVKVSHLFNELMSGMKVSERAETIDSDYVNFAINTTNGRILGGFINYLLWRGRNEYNKANPVKWNEEDKSLLEMLLNKEILEAYTYIGFNFSQFFFLDSKWLIRKIEEFKTIPHNLWAGFFTGFCYGHPPSNEEYYRRFYAHYKRAIENKIYVKSFSNHAIVKHLAAFHVYGFENLEEESLLFQFLNSADSKIIDEMVRFVSRQSDYVNSLEQEKKAETLNRILNLWNYLFDRFKDSNHLEEQAVLGSLTDWIQFLQILNEESYNHLLVGVKYANRYDISNYLINNLNRLKTNGKKEVLSNYIGQILLNIAIEHLHHITELEQKNIVDLVAFLFESDKYKTAAAICNKLAENKITFLIPLYEKYRRK